MKKLLFFGLLIFVNRINAQIITTVVGNGTLGFSGDGGPATAAEISYADQVISDAVGNLYLADFQNSRIRKINTSGIITTIVGNGSQTYTGDGGPAINATIGPSPGVALDALGNLYIADMTNHRIRMINSAGIINTIAGNGTGAASGDGGPAINAGIGSPFAITFDVVGNLYIADIGNNQVRKVNASGVISTIAGNGTAGYSGDGGPATAAKLNDPRGVAVDFSGNVFIAEFGNYCVRKVDTSGIISTFAGKGTGGLGDGGLANVAQLAGPIGITCDKTGNLYIADVYNNRIRKVNAFGIITTIAGDSIQGFSGDGGLSTAAELYEPTGVSLDSSGNLYIEDFMNVRVRKVTNATTIGIPKIGENKNQTSIFPNPSTNSILIQSAAELGTITIYNALGEIVLQTKSKNVQEHIDISNLASGVYIISAQGVYQKIIKE